MDLEQIRTLKILDEISRHSTTSQRELSGKLNVSLGLVNSFVKRLVNNGYFKITTLQRNRVRYTLTPKGAAEKTRLTYEYLKYSFKFYMDTRTKLLLIYEKMIKQEVRRITFYGSGALAEISNILLLQTPLELVAVIDPVKYNKMFMGKIILHPKKLDTLNFDRLLITELNAGTTASQISEKLNTPIEKCVLIQ